MNRNTFTSSERGVSPVIAVVLMVAVAVLLVAVLGTLATSIVSDNTGQSPSAQGTFTMEYKASNHTLEITYEAGDNIPVEDLSLRGTSDEVFTESSVGEELEAGETVTLFNPRLQQEYRVVYSGGDSGGTQTVEKYSPMTEYETLVRFNPTEENTSDFDRFEDKFTKVSGDDGVMWRDQGSYIEFSEEHNPGQAHYRIDLNTDSNSVRLLLDFRARSFEGSGMKMYAVDANGDKIPIVCDAGGGISSCGNRGPTFAFQGNYEVSSDAEIEEIHIKAHPRNVHGNWWDRGQIHFFRVVEPKDDS